MFGKKVKVDLKTHLFENDFSEIVTHFLKLSIYKGNMNL